MGSHSRGRLALRIALLALCQLTASAVDQRTIIPQQEDAEDVESTCRLESFFVVETGILARKAGVPKCNPEAMFTVSMKTGQIFLKDSPESKAHDASASHFFGTYAAPWFLYQAIMDSPYHARNQEDSGMFYVNDYCYYMWWLAAANSKSPDSPGAYLLKVYEELIESASWKRRKGRDFLFFLPYSINQVLDYERSLPGGGIMQEYLDFVCTKLRPALQLTVEQLQGWNMCQNKKAKQSLVVPFVPNVIDPKGAALMESLTNMEHDLPARKERTTLVTFKGRCSHHSRNPSRLLRSYVVAAFSDADKRFDVKCIEKEPTGRLPFAKLLTQMERSIFCLVLPESGQSARLLSEIMLSGCIPVFVGPPFAATPFADDLDYDAFSVFVSLEDHDWLKTSTGNATESTPKDGTVTEKEYEEAMMSAEGLVMDAKLPNAAALPEYLASIPEDAILDGLEQVEKVRRSFLFYPELDSEKPSAVDLLLVNLCRHMNQLANALPDLVPKRRQLSSTR